ncbi:SpoIIE family protein phosphatase [bacterium]|nr:SpoIIE family protein phosphatase [bacterium]
MPRLTIQNGPDKDTVHQITGQRLTLGRSVNNDIQIVDRRMSRTHAEIYFHDDKFYVRDMGSKNGTLLNGVQVEESTQLHNGDTVQVGDTGLTFEDDTATDGGTVPIEPSRRKRDSATSYRLVEERQWGSTRGELRAGISPTTSVSVDTREGKLLKESHKRLEIIYQVTEAIRSVFTLDELLERIMDIIIEVLHPDRGYLLLHDKETGDLTPEVIKAPGGEEEREIKISSSIVDRCMSEGISLLVSDAITDDRFAASESIIANRIRTAMVAPIIYKGDTLGVVYIDTRTRLVPFTQEELELLTGITNQAAMAIMNARLHSQLVEQHKLAREMEIARTIQMNLLPKVYPNLPGYDISAMSLPAKQVGGDYYDFLTLPDGQAGLAIADVSGKGVPAAILTATTRSYLQSEAQHGSSALAQTVETINRMVCRDVTNDMYVTMALVSLDQKSGEIEYVNAGHTHPVILSKSGEFRFLDKGGLFLGIGEDLEYESGKEKLAAGDILLMYTDGVSDIQDTEGVQFGTERLYDMLKDLRTLSAEDIRNRVYQACVQHRGDADQFDDFTLILLKRIDTDSSFDELDLD